MSTRGSMLVLFGTFVLVAVCLYFDFLFAVASKRIVDILGDGVIFNRGLSINGQVHAVESGGRPIFLANALAIHLIGGDDDGDDCRK